MDNRKRIKKPKTHSGRSKWTHTRGFHNNGCIPSGSNNLPNKRRIHNRNEIRDIIQHKATDFRVVNQIYKKTACPRFESPYTAKMNYQIPSNKKKTKKPKVPRVIHLPEIYKKLYLSNYGFVDAGDHLKDEYAFEYVVNMSGDYVQNSKRCMVINVNINDNKNISYHYFKKEILNIVRLIKEASEDRHAILVCCKAGTNRSVSAILAYAMLEKNMSYYDAIRYIVNKKKKSYCYWDSMTNMKFYHYLQQIKIDHKNK